MVDKTSLRTVLLSSNVWSCSSIPVSKRFAGRMSIPSSWWTTVSSKSNASSKTTLRINDSIVLRLFFGSPNAIERFPDGSKSTNRTFTPHLASAAPRFSATALLITDRYYSSHVAPFLGLTLRPIELFAWSHHETVLFRPFRVITVKRKRTLSRWFPESVL